VPEVEFTCLQIAVGLPALSFDAAKTASKPAEI
jgi:hypothetical protein